MAAAKKTTTPGLRVSSHKNGFRRGGRAWSGVTELPVSVLTEEQIAQIKAEPMLTVVEIDLEIGAVTAEEDGDQ
ncbi:MAG: hypothetical protein COX57_02195 [Alphaproteobacteria bacterium CG_4_10_14_0_2_um_filter_63_37]|nr:MAG: hypothetical protein AUJ55_06640 [Proteobacteria bacterium CG1_02_64_396]PJA25671.1 MAG: hypothetical protein COX57_02195 [Alphaproteobacteria bacterium CG_4_10_14_0_2_um_filter_63_37]